MELTDLMILAAEVMDKLSIPYFITGSCASIAYGEPRLTNDIDIVAELQMKDVAALIEKFPMPEFYISEDAVREAIKLQKQFNIIHPTSGLKIDIIVKKKSVYVDSQFERRKKIALSKEKEIDFAAPEDVILMKMEYYRMGASEKHIRDITGMLKISKDIIDQKYISLWAKRLGLEDIWEAILKKIGQ